MDIEQLKLIVSTIGNAADGARDFAMAWLLIEAGKALLGYLIGAAGIVALYKVASNLVHLWRESLFATEIRNMVLPHDAWGPITNFEKEKIMETLRAGMRKG